MVAVDQSGYICGTLIGQYQFTLKTSKQWLCARILKMSSVSDCESSEFVLDMKSMAHWPQ
jgi:hypothetical protein